MEVFLNKDVEKIGLAGEIIQVGDGFARNFLIPKGLAVEITPHNKSQYLAKIRTVKNRKEAIASQLSMLGEKINHISLTLKRKMHDNGQLYGAVNAAEIADALSRQGIAINKNQVEFEHIIKSKGSFKVIIKLAPTIKSSLTVTIIGE